MIIWQNNYFLETMFEMFSVRKKMAVYDTGFNNRRCSIDGIKNNSRIKKFGCSKKDHG